MSEPKPGAPAKRPAPRAPHDPFPWLRDAPTLIRRLVLAEILGPPRTVRRRLRRA